MEIEGVRIEWLGHAGFKIKEKNIIYIDPYNISEGSEKADLILITHSHYDHCSLADVLKIVKEGTRIFSSVDCQSTLSRIKIPIKMEIVEPMKEYNSGNIKINTIPAYNIEKTFHPKSESWVGYVVKINNVLIYHAGDTDFIPEMQILTGHNHKDKKLIALLPVGGKYTMDFEEAAEAAKLIKPFVAVPMHYGTIVGTKEDAVEFVNYCKKENISGEILEKM